MWFWVGGLFPPTTHIKDFESDFTFSPIRPCFQFPFLDCSSRLGEIFISSNPFLSKDIKRRINYIFNYIRGKYKVTVLIQTISTGCTVFQEAIIKMRHGGKNMFQCTSVRTRTRSGPLRMDGFPLQRRNFGPPSMDWSKDKVCFFAPPCRVGARIRFVSLLHPVGLEQG